MKNTLSSWLATLSIALSTFVFVSTEFMPVGLLPDMALGLHRSQAEMGLILTFYAWTVALFSLPLTILTARFERKKLLLFLLFLFTVSNVCVAISPNFYILLLARIAIALSHAIFWSIVTPLSYRVAPKGKESQALGLVIAGACLATVLGVPIGTALGHQFGWRFAFWAVSFVSLLVFFIMFLVLPNLPSLNAGSLKSLPILMKRKSLMLAYLLIVLIVSGHFVAYTYLTPYLGKLGQFSSQEIVIILLVMGSAGVFGSIFSSFAIKKWPRFFFYLPMVFVGVSLFLLQIATLNPLLTYLLCFIWGFSMTGVGLVLQTQVLSIAHDATDVATSIFSGIYNVGIGLGAFIGSYVFDALGLSYVGYVGALFVLFALFFVLWFRVKF